MKDVTWEHGPALALRRPSGLTLQLQPLHSIVCSVREAKGADALYIIPVNKARARQRQPQSFGKGGRPCNLRAEETRSVSGRQSLCSLTGRCRNLPRGWWLRRDNSPMLQSVTVAQCSVHVGILQPLSTMAFSKLSENQWKQEMHSTHLSDNFQVGWMIGGVNKFQLFNIHWTICFSMCHLCICYFYSHKSLV